MRDVFHEKIDDFWYKDKELSKENINLRYGVCDMVIETPTKIILIEVQNKNLGNLVPRLKMYTSRFYTEQNSGKDYKEMKPVEAYIILNYEEGIPAVLKEFEEYDKKIDEQFGNLSKIKIWNIAEAIKKRETIDYDYAKIARLDSYEIEEGKKILEKYKQDKRFKKIAKEIEIYNMDIETYKALKEVENMEMSFELATSMIRHEAEDKGKLEGKLEDVKNMLTLGIDISTITKITGLNESQIMDYQKNHC